MRSGHDANPGRYIGRVEVLANTITLIILISEVFFLKRLLFIVS